MQVREDYKSDSPDIEDDNGLRELKRKLAIMKQLAHPENKDEMIEFLINRLKVAEEAIGTCEHIIDSERKYRN